MISIILPIYNMQDYIASCLDSVISQTYKDIEIICVNDFSMDNSMTIVKNYAKKDERIKIINNEKNRGLGGARNAGLDVAKGDYIMFCDTDDSMYPDMVEKMLNSLLINDSDLVFCDVMLFDSNNTHSPFKPFHDKSISRKRTFCLPDDFVDFCNIWPSAWNKIYKKSVIDKFNIRYHENILYEDHTFYYEYLLKINKVTYLPEPLYVYTTDRKDSIMKTVSPRIFEIFTVLDYIDEILKSNIDISLYNVLMPKIAVRLIWERTINFNKKAKIVNKFYDKANTYLSKFKRKDVFVFKDYFIDKSQPFFYSPFERLLKKIISVEQNSSHDVYYICGIRLKRKNKLRELSTKLDEVLDALQELKGEVLYANK